LKKIDYLKKNKYASGKTFSLKEWIFSILYPVLLIIGLTWDKYFDDIIMISPVLSIIAIYHFRSRKTYAISFSFFTALILPLIKIQSVLISPVLFLILYSVFVFFVIFDMHFILFPAFCFAFQIISLSYFKVNISILSMLPPILISAFFIFHKIYVYRNGSIK